MNDSPNKLLDALDLAAALLLEKAGVGARMDEEKSGTAVTVTEQVKAFEAVVDWAKTRKDLRPPQKEESRFDGIKREFSSAAARRGNKSKAKKASSGSLTSTDFDPGDDPDDNPTYNA